MKRLVGFLAVILILYSIYHDLSNGTLPVSKIENISKAQTKKEVTLPYFEKKVQAGDTVLSIIEDQLNQSIPVPVSVVVDDFEELNKGVSSHEIKAGEKYKFPNYLQIE